MAIADNSGSTIAINKKGIITVSGIWTFRIVFYNGEPWMQFYDSNKWRCKQRGDPCVEIPLDVFYSRVVKICEKGI